MIIEVVAIMIMIWTKNEIKNENDYPGCGNAAFRREQHELPTPRSASQVNFIILAVLAMRMKILLMMMDQAGHFVRIQALLGTFWKLRGRSSSSCLLVLR